MADLTHQAVATPFFARVGAALVDWFEVIAKSNRIVRDIERLNALSDQELARRGVRRENIVHLVTARYGYL